MDTFISDNITTLGIALILSIAIFGAVRAGQVMERNKIETKNPIKTRGALERL